MGSQDNFAINFGNYSWSGAIAYTMPINHMRDAERPNRRKKNIKGPKTMWGQFEAKTTNDSKTINALFDIYQHGW